MSFNFIPGEKVEVPELKYEEKLTLPGSKSALLIVDMQNDFIKEGGSLVVESAKETISGIQQLANSFRKKGSHVIFTQDTHFEGDREWEIWPVHCRKDSWGWQIIDELLPQKNEMVFQKNRYDGFYGTSLEHYLKLWGIDNLVITGTVANICVANTAGSAGLRWYNIIVPADGISAITEFDQALTLRQVSFLFNGAILKSCKNISLNKT
ncbi:MAG: cysteine hydrolase [Ignavibacteriaceae bacterium]|jgi:nicotinamidase-related amidase